MKLWDFQAPLYHWREKIWPFKIIFDREKKMAHQVLSALALQQGRALDLGCGSGASYALLPATLTRIGLDRSPAMARRCRTAHQVVVAAEACRLPFKPHVFSLIGVIGLIEYLSDLEPFFKEMAMTLATPGSIVVTASPPGFYTTLRRLMGHRIRIHTVEHLVQVGKQNRMLLTAVDQTFSQNLFLLQTR